MSPYLDEEVFLSIGKERDKKQTEDWEQLGVVCTKINLNVSRYGIKTIQAHPD